MESITDVQKAGYQIVGAIELIKRYLNRMLKHRTIISYSEKLKLSSYKKLRTYLIGRQAEAISATYDALRVWNNLKSRFKILNTVFNEDAIEKRRFFFGITIVNIPKPVVPKYGKNMSQLKSRISPSEVDII